MSIATGKPDPGFDGVFEPSVAYDAASIVC